MRVSNGMSFVTTDYDLYSAPVILIPYIISCYNGLRYNGTGCVSLVNIVYDRYYHGTML